MVQMGSNQFFNFSSTHTFPTIGLYAKNQSMYGFELEGSKDTYPNSPQVGAGILSFNGWSRDSQGTNPMEIYGNMEIQVADPTSGSEDGQFIWLVRRNGYWCATPVMKLVDNKLYINTANPPVIDWREVELEE